jgi:hypothetical protein
MCVCIKERKQTKTIAIDQNMRNFQISIDRSDETISYFLRDYHAAVTPPCLDIIRVLRSTYSLPYEKLKIKKKNQSTFSKQDNI